jgi:hypothetical protein
MSSTDLQTPSGRGTRLLKASIVGVVFSFAAALFLLAAPVPAHAIDLTGVDCTWSNTIGGVGVVISGSGTGSCSVRWGTPLTAGGKSGLGFDEPASLPSGITLGSPFLLGTLTHYNRTIAAGTAASSSDLTLDVSLDLPATKSFSWTFTIDETPNIAGTCVYPGAPPCSDKITFSANPGSEFFSIGGVDYTLQILGFSTDGGTTTASEFISNEGADNQAQLYARLSARKPGVPTPGALSLFAIGLAGLAYRRGKK